MYENQAKGSYGAYSATGKQSALNYHVITHKDQILNPKSQKNCDEIIVDFLKRNKYNNIAQDKQVENVNEDASIDDQLDTIEDNIDIFQMDKNEIEEQLKQKNAKNKKGTSQRKDRNCKSAFHRCDPELYKYHDEHLAKPKKKYADTTPCCTKYFPSHDAVWKRTCYEGPKWELITGHKVINKIDNSKVYINQGDPMENIAEVYINLEKLGPKLEARFIKPEHNYWAFRRPMSCKPGTTPSSTKNQQARKMKLKSPNIINYNNQAMGINYTNMSNMNSNSAYQNGNLDEDERFTEFENMEEMEKTNYNKYNEFTGSNEGDISNRNIKGKLRERLSSGNKKNFRPVSGRPGSVRTNITSRPLTSNTNNSNRNVNTGISATNTSGGQMLSPSKGNEYILSDPNKVQGEYNISSINKRDLLRSNMNNTDNAEKEINNSDISEGEKEELYDKITDYEISNLALKRPNTATSQPMYQYGSYSTRARSAKWDRGSNMKGTVRSKSNFEKNFEKKCKKTNKKYQKYAYVYKNRNMNKNKNKIARSKINAPDFNQMISRKYLDDMRDSKIPFIPFYFPNFRQTRERDIMMVVYDRNRHKKKIQTDIKGIEPSLFYDPSKMLDKVNNHRAVIAPNFKNMFSRPPAEGTPLPTYMRRVPTRQAAYTTTDLSLKMNYYSEGKFLSNYSSFEPKKSFNKFVNLNLLKSKPFLDNVFGETNIEGNNDYIAKSMKFYNKNYDDLLKESMVTRFDNVTYKTITKENKVDQRDIEKFLAEYKLKNQTNK